MRTAFTMIELVFVIVILGVLAAVAIPKLAATRDDAIIARMANAIGTSASEVAGYVVAQGDVNTSLAAMSATIKGMIDGGEATEPADYTVFIRMGAQNNCVIMAVANSALDANLTLSFTATTDRMCEGLQNAIEPAEYPIPLKGERVVH